MGDELEDCPLQGSLREWVPECDEVGDAEERYNDEKRLGGSQICRTCVTNHVTWGSQL